MLLNLFHNQGKGQPVGGEGINWMQTATFEDSQTDGTSLSFDQLGGANQGNLTNTTAAAMVGSRGISIVLVAGETSHGEFVTSVSNEKLITLEFWLDQNSSPMANGDRFQLVNLNGSGPVTVAARIELRNFGGANQLSLVTYDDSSSADTNHSPTGLADAPSLIKLQFKTSAAAGLNNGYAKLYEDNVLKASSLGLDNDTCDTDEIEIGAILGVDAGTSGTIYIDHARWAREIG